MIAKKAYIKAIKTLTLMRAVYLLISLLLIPGLLSASHIVGGEMTYRCLGNNQYEITLIVYRDCVNADPGAGFDNPASIGVYDQNNVLQWRIGYIGQLVVRPSIIDTLALRDLPECIVFIDDDNGDGNEQGVCVERAIYKQIVTLPSIPGGYRFVYQRCCRNETLDNIVDPIETGMSIVLDINEEAFEEECNSSPSFNGYPPIYICTGVPLNYDFSAMDPDGDMVVYSLCTPFTGASKQRPFPAPPRVPFTDPVTWELPYSLDNLMGGEVPLTISSDGILTGIPETPGQFLIRVCVEEYRNGNLLSTISRDFEFNVRECVDPEASFIAENDPCLDNTINFTSQSVGANTFNWFFEWPDTTAMSEEENPTYTYDEPGTYMVALITNRGTTCSDTAFMTVQAIDLMISQVSAVFDYVRDCGSFNVSFMNQSDETAIFQWTFGDTTQPGFVSNERNPTYAFPGQGTYSVELIVMDSAGCFTDTSQQAVYVGPILVDFSDTIEICVGQQAPLNPDWIPGLVYQWDESPAIGNPSEPNPVVIITETELFTVTVTDTMGQCTAQGQVLVRVEGIANFNSDTIIGCRGDLIFLNPDGDPGYIYLWSPTEFFDDPNEVNPGVRLDSSQLFQVRIQDSAGICQADFFKYVEIFNGFELDFSFVQACNDSTVLFINRSSGVEIVQWYLGADTTGQLISTETDSFEYVFPDTGLYLITLITPEKEFCNSITKVVEVFKIPTSLIDTILACEPGSIELNPQGSTELTYQWAPAEGLDDPASPNPVATVTETTTYSVTITNPGIPQCPVAGMVTVLIVSSIDDLIITPSDIMICRFDTVVLIARGELTDSVKWYGPDGELLGTNDTIEIVVDTGGLYRAVAYVGICVFEDTVELRSRMIRFGMDKDAPVCSREPVELFIINGTDFLIDSVIWSPDDDIALGQGSERVVVRPERSTMYDATIYFEDGCVSTQSFFVDVSDIEDRIFIISGPDTIFFGEETTLVVTDELGLQYSWEPADLVDAPASPTTIARPPQTTTFTVTVTDEFECSVQRQVQIVVIMVICNPPYIFFPNAFTPNGDGVNDRLMVRGEYIEAVELYIYNRWGQLMYETRSPNSSWDGTFNGKELSPDVYGYYLKVTCIGGDTHTEKGNVTILR